MLNGAMLVWFSLTAASLLFVIWDSVTNAVTSWVQRLAWILVTAYTGPVVAFFYLLACRRPFPGSHDQFTRALWKQSVNSEMHCLAGDATGILIAALIVPTKSAVCRMRLMKRGCVSGGGRRIRFLTKPSSIWMDMCWKPRAPARKAWTWHITESGVIIRC